MREDADRLARLVLSCIVEPGDPRLWQALHQESPAEVLARVRRSEQDSVWARRLAALDLRTVESLARRHGLRYVVPGDDEWPDRVAVLDACEPVQDAVGAPLCLWVRGAGDLARLTEHAVSIVGSRACTPYGERVSTDLAAALADQGVTVVSGGAFGIDAAAHRGALSVEGPTVAVLAGGLDEFYPRAHTTLLEQVAQGGLLVSELAPGQRPSRRRFLIRNRLVAALSRGTIVVEANARSGARNTATWAASCGRQVMAVPGPVSNSTSYTPHWLIRSREAELVTGADDVLELVGPMGEHLVRRATQPRLLDRLGDAEAAVYEALPSRGGRDTGDLALRAGLSVPRTLAALGSLTAAGLVAPLANGSWRLGEVQDRPLPRRQR